MRAKTPRVETSSSDAFDSMPEITQIEMLTLADACVPSLNGLSVREVPGRFLRSPHCLMLGAAAIECGREADLLTSGSKLGAVGSINRIATDALTRMTRPGVSLAPVRLNDIGWAYITEKVYGQLVSRGTETAPMGYAFVHALALGQVAFQPFERATR